MQHLSTEQLKAFIEKPFAFVERVGLKAHRMEPRRIKLGLPLKGNENHLGIMYAGALFTVAELPGGALYLTTFDVEKFYPVLKEMNIRFRRPATSDVTVEAALSQTEVARITTEAETRGKSEFILKTVIKDTEGTAVAETEGVYQLRAIRQSPEPPAQTR
ncbi:MAG: YiiD C-terminal domain-containing protein [Desulfosarcina sp.]|nr:YiiD C-terminal domain-containing protein [Desulfobacterales bacterium]